MDLKTSAIFAMGRTGEVSWLPTLVKELDNREPSIRYETANACGDLGEEDVVPYLLDLLDDEDYQVQIAALNALGKIGGSLAKRALTALYRGGRRRPGRGRPRRPGKRGVPGRPHGLFGRGLGVAQEFFPP